MSSTLNQIVKLDLGVEPEAAVSGGFLLQTEYSAFLLFSAKRRQPDGMRSEAGTAVLTFERPTLTKFGLPNDEASTGHPILGPADLGYEIVEVLNSSWLAEAERQNQVAFPHWTFSGVRHFAVTLHDSTFECLARGVSVEVSVDPYDSVLRRVVERALDDPR